MKKQLLLLFLITIATTIGYAQELVVVDLTTPNEVTITANASGLSVATVSGSDTTGFYLEDFFTIDQALAETLVSGDLTSASNTADNSPDLFRGTAGTDPGLNIWSYTNDATSDFTLGQQAFSGQATWTLSVDEYNAMLSSPASGNIYFPADDVSDVAGATLIGTYSVINPSLSVPDVHPIGFSYYPNPVKDVLNISSQKVIVQVDIYNMLGQYVSAQKLNALNGAVNTASLAKGTYFFRTTFQDGTTKSFKVVKNDF